MYENPYGHNAHSSQITNVLLNSLLLVITTWQLRAVATLQC